MSEAQRIYDDRFGVGNPRSPEYKAGALYVLRRMAGEIPKAECPHQIGTAQADAWLAGSWEGVDLWRNAQQSKEERTE
ncbi:TPA: hypothetical protein L6A15_05710 [Pseudomonas aeruginosa]|uniref:hypothetical protein n=1 Tax=Pseudomonas aeruginosa TaxID=287 RepID=UPI0003C56342|nr:hypothetical protein [Pseudomonas aeruginosa]AHA21497.1 hypothetical protein PA1S_16080 [Pseudomonas aeruginosa PA1]AHA27296.1 hypothetical protein PA1R_gp5596 [Pseudomonas aeruginosa PA1R]ALE48931.1 hypothetical protein AOD73_16075 [Pseudomonas aeruginosa]EKF6769674.1 hypothetical protein [Pseudomonas aeruginosa]MBX6130228.1 hypothetical protein [Pseudomonas aeruginosa]